MSIREEIKKRAVNWLLEPKNPCVRFWALQQLLDKPSADPDVQKTQHALMESSIVKTILNAQHEKGYWVNPDNLYLPKYRATTHSLLILAELGTKRNHKIEKGIEHVFGFQSDSGHFLISYPKTARGRASKATDNCCLDGNILYYLIHFG
ncbi:MAG: hypothetical protein ACTSW4_01290 [Candidatus Ranarchaeia archaeon]